MSEHTAGEQGAEKDAACPWCHYGDPHPTFSSCSRVTPPAVPATPDAGDASEADVEALAEELWADSPSPGVAPTDIDRDLARRILASDWLAARVSAAATKARAEERERLLGKDGA